MKKTVVAAVLALASTFACASDYVLQIGTFDDHEAAEAWAAKLRRTGIPAYLETIDDGRERLRAGPFESQAEAKIVRERVRAMGLARTPQPDEGSTQPKPPANQPAKSAAHNRPFAYTDGPNGRVLLYKSRCEAEGTNEDWSYAVIHQPAGYRPGCWRQFFDQPSQTDVVEFCLTGQSDSASPIHLGNACLFGGAGGVYKGDPERRAFYPSP